MPHWRDARYELIEACYASGGSAAWTRHLTSKAHALLDTGLGVGASIIREADEHTREVEALATRGPVEETFSHATSVAATLDEGAYRAIYYPASTVVRAATAFTRTSGSRRVLTYVRSRGVGDAVGILAYPEPGWVFVLTVALGRSSFEHRGMLKECKLLQRHMHAGLRLQLVPDQVPVAVLSSDGRVLHADDDVRTAQARDRLSTAARSIEAARDGRQDALRCWEAVIAGRWNLVPRTDPDGRRFYVAYENGPLDRTRTLGWAERSVLCRVIAGQSNKEIAFQRGVHPSAVSRMIGTITTKLGFRSQSELFAFAERIVDTDRVVAGLTLAEREIASLLAQGRTNAEIARERGTSVYTVANQVSAILRKSHAPNRRAVPQSL